MNTYFTWASSRLEANKAPHEVLPTFPVLSGLRKKEKIEDLKKNLPLDNPFVVILCFKFYHKQSVKILLPWIVIMMPFFTFQLSISSSSVTSSSSVSASR